MHRLKSPVPLWLGYPLLFILGIGTGVIAAGYEWSKNGYLAVPQEIVVAPPPSNITWCFPNTSLRNAVRVRAALAGRLHENASSKKVDSLMVVATIKRLNDSMQLDHATYPLTLLRHRGQRYEVLVQGIGGELTLATEEGTYYLHQIPERFHEHYDSLVRARMAR